MSSGVQRGQLDQACGLRTDADESLVQVHEHELPGAPRVRVCLSRVSDSDQGVAGGLQGQLQQGLRLRRLLLQRDRRELL
jgi:hypothetical protein